MRAAMAESTIRCAFVSRFPLLPMHATGIIAGLIRVTRAANRLRHIRGMGVWIVGFVTAVAGEAGMCALGKLRRLVVARRAIRRSERTGIKGGGPQQEERTNKGLPEAAPAGHGLEPRRNVRRRYPV